MKVVLANETYYFDWVYDDKKHETGETYQVKLKDGSFKTLPVYAYDRRSTICIFKKELKPAVKDENGKILEKAETEEVARATVTCLKGKKKSDQYSREGGRKASLEALLRDYFPKNMIGDELDDVYSTYPGENESARAAIWEVYRNMPEDEPKWKPKEQKNKHTYAEQNIGA